ncbi:hypothetical protein ACSBR2_033608 [Camellia fascicularis]
MSCVLLVPYWYSNLAVLLILFSFCWSMVVLACCRLLLVNKSCSTLQARGSKIVNISTMRSPYPHRVIGSLEDITGQVLFQKASVLDVWYARLLRRSWSWVIFELEPDMTGS